MKRVLFVCTANVDRSPTAAKLLEDQPGFVTLSAGTWSHASTAVTQDLLDWADVVFVMESRHRDQVMAISGDVLSKVVVLDVPDVYVRDDPELVALLKLRLAQHLGIRW